MRKDKELTKIYAKKYYQEHKDVIKQRAKDFYQKLKEDSKCLK